MTWSIAVTSASDSRKYYRPRLEVDVVLVALDCHVDAPIVVGHDFVREVSGGCRCDDPIAAEALLLLW